MNVIKESLDLEQLNGAELGDLIRYRLQGLPAGGPALDPRGDIRPHEWILSAYLNARSGLQQRLSHVLGELLGEIEDSGRWSNQAQVELLDLLQQVGDEQVTRSLWAALRRQPVSLDAASRRRAARLLKVLIARGHRGTPEFWLEWFDRLGPDYGALILSGLLEHGPSQVAAHLERLVASPKALRAVLRFLPSLEDRWGRDTVIRVLRDGLPRLPADSAERFKERYSELRSTTAQEDPAAPDSGATDFTVHRKMLWSQKAKAASYNTMSRGWGGRQPESRISKELVVPPNHSNRGEPIALTG